MRKIKYSSSFTTGSTSPPAPSTRDYGVLEVRVKTDAKCFTHWTKELQQAILNLVEEYARLAGFESCKVDRITCPWEEQGGETR